MSDEAVNTALVENPPWKGLDGEMAIVVSRGEPPRSDLQMEQAVAKQLRDYVLHYTKLRPSEIAIAVAVQSLAKDHITPKGMVALTREHLSAYVQAAMKGVSDLEADGA